MATCVSVMRKYCVWGNPIVTHREITKVLLQRVTRSREPWIRSKADYDWLNPRSLRTMSAYDDLDNLA